jgi:hypothetical protein
MRPSSRLPVANPLEFRDKKFPKAQGAPAFFVFIHRYPETILKFIFLPDDLSPGLDSRAPTA